MNGVPNGVSHAHLSPPYVARAASGSPAMSQAAAAQTPSAVGSPRPPSAQAHLTAAPVVPTTAMQRPAANIAHYFPSVPNIHGQSFTYEQMQQALGLQALLQVRWRPLRPILSLIPPRRRSSDRQARRVHLRMVVILASRNV